ncbi:MAG TPA: squalene synthase HpnC [Usitatibacteraceae bacterium]|nr:squalene synthase HpnC [Usitatibacteraceae bacterium]
MPIDHYENFPVASILLPKHLRRPVELIYAFARSADDFADEGQLPPEERLAKLEDYDAELVRIAAGEDPKSTLFRDLQLVIAVHALPVQLFRDLVDAFKQDVTQTRYADFGQLLDYCRRSANPVGRLMLCLFRQTDPRNLAECDAICTALQLANHWQDVAVDWKKNGFGRVYLPQDDLASFGLGDLDIERQVCSDAWSRMMDFQCERTRALMHSGMPLAKRLGGRIGAELRFVVAGGLAILDKIQRVRGDVFRQRPVLTKRDWIAIAPRALLGL